MDDTDEAGLEEPRLRKRGRPAGATSRAAPISTTEIDPAAAVANVDAKSIVDWLTQLGGGAAVKVKVTRSWPKEYKGQPVGGLLGVFDELISEETIKERFGGGKFQVQVHRQLANGQFHYAGQRTVEIGVPPLVDQGYSENTAMPVSAPEDAGLARQALGIVAASAAEARQRAERVETELRDRMSQPAGVDTGLIDLVVTPLRDQIRVMQEDTRRREATLAEVLNRKPETDPMQSKLIERFIDGDNTRLEQVRTAHAAELRMLREAHQEDLKRVEDRYARMFDSNERAHARELDLVRSSHAAEVSTRDIATKTQVESLNAQNRQLERELTSVKTELAETRAKKDVPIEEQMTKLLTLRDSFQSLTGSGNSADAEEEGPVWKQVVDTVINSQLAQGVAQRISGAQALPPQPRVAVPRAMVRRPQPQVPVHAAPQAQAPVQAQPAPSVPKVQLDLPVVTEAVKYLEIALQNEVDVVSFAQTIRSMVPASIIHSLRVDGIDGLMQHVPPSSPIQTQAGLTFLRNLAKILSEQK